MAKSKKRPRPEVTQVSPRKSKEEKSPITKTRDDEMDDNPCTIENDASKVTHPLNPPSPSPLPPPPSAIVGNTFQSIDPPLSPGVLSALNTHYKFTSMTPVQSTVIPLFLKNKDVYTQAVTGSGKTLAFLIPVVEMILRRTVLLTRRQIGGLVISPTRELARQTHDVASVLCRFCSLPPPLLLVGGGKGYRPVQSDLVTFGELGSDIVVATPGRLEDVLSRYSDIQVNELECLVLDEADVLLDMGFEVSLTNILARLPRMRRTGLFSATRGTKGGTGGDGAVKRLMARAGLRNPVIVNVAIAAAPVAGTVKSNEEVLKPQEQSTPTSLTNYYIVSPLEEKISRLVAFLKQHRDEKVVVFFLTCACVEFYGLALQHLLTAKSSTNKDEGDQEADGSGIELLHGKLAPKRREKAMERFRNRKRIKDTTKHNGGLLLCTDVAARGLDVPDIDWTVQFDAPMDPSQYIHRVGRSARAGRIGSSLLFLTPKEESFIDFLRARKVPITEIPNEVEVCAPSRSRVLISVSADKVDKSNEKPNTDEDKQVQAESTDDKNDESSLSVEKEMTTIPDILVKIRNMVLKDRDMLEKGTKAFTSYIEAYKKMRCAFIFRFASLDLGVLATSFCLLRLPKMPELRDKVGKLNFKPAGPEIDIYAIRFKDKARERARQKRLAAEIAAGGKNAKQIKAEQRAAEKIRRAKERRAEEIGKGRNPNKKRGKQAMIYDEWDALAKEERLHKKLRGGKITKEQYKVLMYGEGAKGDSDAESE